MVGVVVVVVVVVVTVVAGMAGMIGMVVVTGIMVVFSGRPLSMSPDLLRHGFRFLICARARERDRLIEYRGGIIIKKKE